jgi:aflatoxin B1 aldehyde reductase
MPHSVEQQRVKVVLGTALFGDSADPQAKINTTEDAKKLLDIYRERGYSEIDTARGYPVGAPGSSERLLGELNDGSWMTLDTKVISWEAGTHKKERIAESVEGSLHALKTQKVCLFRFHFSANVLSDPPLHDKLDSGLRTDWAIRFTSTTSTPQTQPRLLKKYAKQ